MFYPRKTDRTGLVPVIVLVMEQAVVVVVVRMCMTALCCSAAKAVKQWFRMQLPRATWQGARGKFGSTRFSLGIRIARRHHRVRGHVAGDVADRGQHVRDRIDGH